VSFAFDSHFCYSGCFGEDQKAEVLQGGKHANKYVNGGFTVVVCLMSSAEDAGKRQSTADSVLILAKSNGLFAS